MRKRTRLIALFLLPAGAFTARAQDERNPFLNGEKIFLGGLVAGANITQVDGDYLNGYHKVGINAGAIGMVRLGSRLAGSLELLYSQKGSHSVTTSESPYFGTYFAKYTIHLNYAEVPVMLHYFVTPKYHVGIGASYNVLISSREDYNDASYTTVLDPSLYPFSKQTIDGIAGGSMVLWRGLVLNARFQYSLSTIRRLKDIPSGLGFEHQKNNMLTFRLMYFF